MYKKMELKYDKGVAGLTILLSLITMMFVIGLLVMIFALMGGELNDATQETIDVSTYYDVTPEDSYEANSYDAVATGWGVAFVDWINLENVFDDDTGTFGITTPNVSDPNGYTWSSVNITYTVPAGTNISQSYVQSVVADAGQENFTLTSANLNGDGTLTIIVESYWENASNDWGNWFMYPSDVDDWLSGHTGYEFCGGTCNSSNIYEVDVIFVNDTGSIIEYEDINQVVQNSPAGAVISDTTSAIAGVTSWFSIFIVIASMVVLIILTVIIITAIKGSGLMSEGGA